MIAHQRLLLVFLFTTYIFLHWLLISLAPLRVLIYNRCFNKDGWANACCCHGNEISIITDHILYTYLIFTGSGSLTVLKRPTSSQSSDRPLSRHGSKASTQFSLESNSYASVDLGNEKLPDINTAEASRVCSVRWKLYLIQFITLPLYVFLHKFFLDYAT